MNFENLPPLDIKSFIQTSAWIMIIFAIFSFWRGIQKIRKSFDVGFYSIRRAQILKGWQGIFIAFILLIFGILVKNFGEPIAYQYIPVTNTTIPTVTNTPSPTITLTPTLTLTPSITPTPAESYTPSPTFTPNIPAPIELQFEGGVDPPAEAAFSEIVFSEDIDALYQPIHPDTVFNNPIDRIYANFSYAQMADGVQWTALWYRDAELIYFESLVWDGGSGGYGYSDWEPSSSEWLPGNYIVHLFLGLQVKASASFILNGDPATETLTPSVTPTVTNTNTSTPTLTPSASITPTASSTRAPTYTPITPSPTNTHAPTYTPEGYLPDGDN